MKTEKLWYLECDDLERDIVCSVHVYHKKFCRVKVGYNCLFTYSVLFVQIYSQFDSRDIFLLILVLPNRVKESFVNELDRRLDLDFDNMLQSPKLRLQLSPAELDKQLLEFYKSVVDGPSGDILRQIGGGSDVALQDLYIKKNSLRGRSKNPQSFGNVSIGPFDALGEDSDKEERTASQWVNSVLRRNLPKIDDVESHREDHAEKKKDKSDELTMSLSRRGSDLRPLSCYPPRPPLFRDSFCVGRSRVSSFSLLI